jgi:hypothetical protein
MLVGFLKSWFGFLLRALYLLEWAFFGHVSSSTAIKASFLILMPSLVCLCISLIDICKDRWIDVHRYYLII